MRRNPGSTHLTRATAKDNRQYEHILETEVTRGRSPKTAKRIAAATVRKGQKTRNKTVIKAKTIQHLDVSKVHNPRRRIKVRNKYVDLVVKGQAKLTPKGWKLGAKTYPQGKGTVAVSKGGYFLDRSTGFVYAKKERNLDHRDSAHPIHVTDYWQGRRGYKTPWQRAHEAGQKQLFQMKNGKRKNGVISTVKKTVKAAVKGIKKAVKKNPDAIAQRKEFAGRFSGFNDLYFPQGTPQGISKLGKLVLIRTDAGDIKPVSGTAWLCRDLKGKLHIGTTQSDAALWSGPAGSLGEVKRLEYEEAKPHLGYSNPTVFFHKMGEETGERPTLYSDGAGGLKFRGGRYRIESRGIVN